MKALSLELWMGRHRTINCPCDAPNPWACSYSDPSVYANWPCACVCHGRYNKQIEHPEVLVTILDRSKDMNSDHGTEIPIEGDE